MQYDYLRVERNHTLFSDPKTYEHLNYGKKKEKKWYQGCVAAMGLASQPKGTVFDPC